jgi:hypothetical protein
MGEVGALFLHRKQLFGLFLQKWPCNVKFILPENERMVKEKGKSYCYAIDNIPVTIW